MKPVSLVFFCMFSVSSLGFSSDIITLPNYELLSWTPHFSDLPGECVDSDGLPVEIERLNPDTSCDTFELDYTMENQMLVMESHNRSDDVWMGLSRWYGGLNAHQSYEMCLDLTFFSDARTGGVGIGGSPDAVHLKFGAAHGDLKFDSTFSGTDTIYFDDQVFDKGNQASVGSDVVYLGQISTEVSDGCFKNFCPKQVSACIPVVADDEGRVNAVLGSDSGFEGVTKLFYKEIEVSFR
ncbi:hypothetical protein [Pseudobacteriovorax antillogorgiicola]|uniref:Uncharacterized protein n=1 Tax=Pseudobacteriovorax antillogorgiicola TaxID=1513793 RepID=A0A1Y6CKK1_9BACT|nr:hypothetical protein [Pseudobacteriovorax antillogorgiicola]TCS45674.1 hypothetical protein EDD56_12768 [Pseudobacteriovorax antillogorgiicola]SMF73118.1 hypothetical protein SAMN06296036_12767 [Pseudobacteriovorax antillogorgiicola]